MADTDDEGNVRSEGRARRVGRVVGMSRVGRVRALKRGMKRGILMRARSLHASKLSFFGEV